MDDERNSEGGPGAGLGATWTEAPWFRPGLLFGAGLLVGWWLFGWWLWPARWDGADLSDLNLEGQATYVQMVADLYQQEDGRDDRLARAERRLGGFDEASLDRVLGLMVAPGRDPVDAQHARLLAAAVGVVPEAPAPFSLRRWICPRRYTRTKEKTSSLPTTCAVASMRPNA